ncbi:MAG: hypothetical protein LBE84_09745 [Planctomycetota bacterium]|jgi:hypothetical protein|nr:hypothetical protein [Planctomycetota bacterium]
MIWIARDLELLADSYPGAENISFSSTGDILHGGKTYRMLTPKMFSRLREDKDFLWKHSVRYGGLIAEIFNLGLQGAFGIGE